MVAVSCKELIKLRAQNLMKFDFTSSVRMLKINGMSKNMRSVTNLSFINMIDSLEIVEIDCLDSKMESDDLEISLPRLRSMEIERIHCAITLNTPKLSRFKCMYGDQLRLVTFLHLDSLTHLYVHHYDYSINVGYRFNNLTALHVSDRLSANVLIDMPFLKELYVQCNNITSRRYVNLQKEICLILERNAYRGRVLSIRFYGFQLEDITQLHELRLADGDQVSDFAFDERNLIKLLVNNFPKMIESSWLTSINYHMIYTELVRIPTDFYAVS